MINTDNFLNIKTPSIAFSIWMFGFISGFALLTTGNTLNFWIAKNGIDAKTIGIFSIISLPYAFNFLWAPLVDSTEFPILKKFFTHRKAWILGLSLIFAIILIILGSLDPNSNIILFGSVAFIASFISSTNDISLNAFRSSMISKNDQGPASGIYTFGYKIGMLIASSGAIYASKFTSWKAIYITMSMCLIASTALLIYITKESDNEKFDMMGTRLIDKNFQFSQILPFLSKILKPLGPKQTIFYLISFLLLYRLADNYINAMINYILLSLGYDEFHISLDGKTLGFISSIIGGIYSGYAIKRFGMYYCLIIFGIIHSIAHLSFIPLHYAPESIMLLIAVVGFESFTGGMTMAAYIALITSICSGKYRGTQYSFLSAMMGASRSIFPTISGIILQSLGYEAFFILTTLISLPGILLVVTLKDYIKKLER